MIRVFIADDHALIRAGIRQLVQQDSTIRVVGEAADGETLLRALRRAPPDVLLLDISMPGPRFLDLLRQIRASLPRLPVLVVSVHPEGVLALRAIEGGAAGYVNKSQPPAELLEAVKKVSAGGRYVSPALGERLAMELQAQARAYAGVPLSAREREVLVLLGGGRSNKEIAQAFGISPKTVTTYRARLLRKLNLRTNVELVRYAVESGIT